MQIRAFLYLAAMLSPVAAFAQTDAPPPFQDTWKFRIGIGAGSIPKFPGSDASRASVIPMIGAEYGRFYIGGVPGAGSPAGVGMYLLRDSGWTVGVGVGANLRSPRKASDSPRLTGTGDIARTETGSLFANYEWHWLAIRSSVQTDIAGKKEGTTASLDLEGRLPLPGGFVLTAGPGLVWADHQYQQTFFGVSKAQSLASGLSAYDARSGVNTVRLNLGANYRISPHWDVGLRGSLGRLTGAATDSPITESRNQNTFALITSYGF